MGSISPADWLTQQHILPSGDGKVCVLTQGMSCWLSASKSRQRGENLAQLSLSRAEQDGECRSLDLLPPEKNNPKLEVCQSRN